MNPTAVRVERNDRLLKWFNASARDLPWRQTVDPYPVLVSEVMLQQTQVSRVIPKFDAFMANWPKVTDLAEAPTDELLRTWSGLGYNRRALRLREASQLIAANDWPDSIRGLMDLPGVGPYTAAAIGSISFGEDTPAVDTNLKRVLSRWAGEPLDGSALDAYAHDVVGHPAGTWNQALMDLGATLCTPKTPECSRCPVSEWCTQPAVYEPPPRQSRFEGSHRQLRGALLRAHLAGMDLHEAGHDLDRSEAEIDLALSALEAEGLINVAIQDC
ncbi:MAG: A/G-specific adenine glycosylase [Actinobacteria bacterium]|nr:MAG: A/G-specific adenine glycosylase [Actinomycetota bacterium]